MTVETLSHGAAISKCEELVALIARHTNGNGNRVHTTEINLSNAAYQVGYESPSQFIREYSRMFDAPPH